jgi:dynein heavy chain
VGWILVRLRQQGIKWLKQKEAGNGLAMIQLSQKNWNKKIERALQNGETIIIENLGEEIDATLEPVLARAVYKKGRNLFIR